MKLFSKKVHIKENEKVLYLRVPQKLFINEKISHICALSECKVFYIEVYGLHGKDAIQLKSELNADNKEVSVNKGNDITISVNIEQMKKVLETIEKYNYEELGIWDTLDRTIKANSKFLLSYWRREYNYFEIYLDTTIPNKEQMKKVWL